MHMNFDIINRNSKNYKSKLTQKLQVYTAAIVKNNIYVIRTRSRRSKKYDRLKHTSILLSEIRCNSTCVSLKIHHLFA